MICNGLIALFIKKALNRMLPTIADEWELTFWSSPDGDEVNATGVLDRKIRLSGMNMHKMYYANKGDTRGLI